MIKRVGYDDKNLFYLNKTFKKSEKKRQFLKQNSSDI